MYKNLKSMIECRTIFIPKIGIPDIFCFLKTLGVCMSDLTQRRNEVVIYYGGMLESTPLLEVLIYTRNSLSWPVRESLFCTRNSLCWPVREGYFVLGIHSADQSQRGYILGIFLIIIFFFFFKEYQIYLIW